MCARRGDASHSPSLPFLIMERPSASIPADYCSKAESSFTPLAMADSSASGYWQRNPSQFCDKERSIRELPMWAAPVSPQDHYGANCHLPLIRRYCVRLVLCTFALLRLTIHTRGECRLTDSRLWKSAVSANWEDLQ